MEIFLLAAVSIFLLALLYFAFRFLDVDEDFTDKKELMRQNFNFLTFAHKLYSDDKMNPGVDMTPTLNHISDCLTRTTNVSIKLTTHSLDSSDLRILKDVNNDCRKLYETLPSFMRQKGFDEEYGGDLTIPQSEKELPRLFKKKDIDKPEPISSKKDEALKSEEDKIRETVQKVLNNFLLVLKQIDKADQLQGSSSLGLTLDIAAAHKRSSVENAKDQIFRDSDGIEFNVDDSYRYPDLFNKHQLLLHLKGYENQMKNFSHEPEVVSGMTIYYLSAAAFTFPEFRNQVEEMWFYLSKGFASAETFDPKLDGAIDLIGKNMDGTNE